MTYQKLAAAAFFVSGLAACETTTTTTIAGTPSVGSSSDLTAFQGAKGGQAEMGIQALGFQPARTRGLTTWWYNPSTGACAEIVTSDGRYSSVTMLPSSAC
ncbi:hypothetical protein [Albibacillus kandeliae]|uniref:hypothetical protein n=1 Tax=Albibacillus kandeliae TaxID=2174228 RepID=UPI000D687C72|nr:hypothetical protein [Albibacillus kandeliae]